MSTTITPWARAAISLNWAELETLHQSLIEDGGAPEPDSDDILLVLAAILRNTKNVRTSGYLRQMTNLGKHLLEYNRVNLSEDRPQHGGGTILELCARSTNAALTSEIKARVIKQVVAKEHEQTAAHISTAQIENAKKASDKIMKSKRL